MLQNELFEAKAVPANKKMKKLQIGLIMDSIKIFAWEYALIEKIIGSDFGTIALVILMDSQEKGKNRFSKKFCSNLLYRLFWIIENIKFKPNPNAFEVVNAKELLNDIEILRVKPEQKCSSSQICYKYVEKIVLKELNVFILFSLWKFDKKILNYGKYSVWAWDHGISYNNENLPAGLLEVLERVPTTYSTLKIIKKDTNKKIAIHRSYSSTDFFSVNKTCNRHYWKLASIIARKLIELHKFGEKNFFQRLEQENKVTLLSKKDPKKAIKNHHINLGIFKHLLRSIKIALIKTIFIDQWIILFYLRNDISYSFFLYKKVIPPKDRLWADPQIIYKNNKYYIYVEEKLFETGKGHISLIVMDENGNYREPIKVIDKPYHLSYPFVFRWKEQYFMIPESSSNKTIELYKCVQFPNNWEFQKNLMDNIVASDTTLFYHNEKWWLFANIQENEGATNWDELFLFYANSPFSDSWKAHPKNPIISDVRRARPAGKIFKYEGKIYRPSQFGSIDLVSISSYSISFNLII